MAVVNVKLTEDEQEMIRTVLSDIIEESGGGGWEPEHWRVLLSAHRKVASAQPGVPVSRSRSKRSPSTGIRGIRS